jgi:hypothetical protein
LYIPYRKQANRFRKVFYDNATIARVKRAADIVPVARDYTKLRKSGAGLVGLCPCHKERTPSFYLYPAKQRYRCFGCQAKGDVFSLLMAVERVDFPEAVRQLAARFGIALTPLTDAELRGRDRRRTAEAEGMQVLAYRRAVLDALLEARAGCIRRQERCLRVLGKRPAGSATARRATVIFRAYDAAIDDVEARIDTIKRARWEDLVSSFRKSGWQSAQPRDLHGEHEQLAAAVVAMLAHAQQRDQDVPHIPIDPNDQPQHVPPHQAARITAMVDGAMAQMTVANKLVGVGQ